MRRRSVVKKALKSLAVVSHRAIHRASNPAAGVAQAFAVANHRANRPVHERPHDGMATLESDPRACGGCVAGRPGGAHRPDVRPRTSLPRRPGSLHDTRKAGFGRDARNDRGPDGQGGFRPQPINEAGGERRLGSAYYVQR